MVENSLGRLWVEGHPDDGLKANWKYYLEEAEQGPEVQAQLQAIRAEYALMKPEEILCIDPCCGSGHILVYLFDVLVQIYTAYGYPTREAVASIVRNNLWGLDIDDRAAQLAYFAVMMKARQYDKGWFRRGIEPHIYAIQESNGITSAPLHDMGIDLLMDEYGQAVKQTMRLIEDFHDAKEYGSIIQPAEADWDLLRRFAVPRWESEGRQIPMNIHGEIEAAPRLQSMIDLGQALSQKYHVVVTNPPYMGASGMGTNLSKFVKDNYSDSKSDMSTVFMERCLSLCYENGYMAMINIPVWMFITSYEKLRDKILHNYCYVNMVHPGRGIFGSDFGTTSFVILKNKINDYNAIYRRLFSKPVEVATIEERKECFLSGVGTYYQKQECYLNIPGHPVAYWISNVVLNTFGNNPLLGSIARPRIGQNTGDNNRFLRLWYELSFTHITFGLSHDELTSRKYKWIPYNKGGEFRRWYGNQDYVINWEDDGKEIKEFAVERNHGKHWSRYIQNIENMCKPGVTWSFVTSGSFSVRYLPKGFICDVAGSAIFPDSENIITLTALCNSSYASYILGILNPTINMQAGNVASIPVNPGVLKNLDIDSLAEKSISISRTDWDSFETSWDFADHPIVRWSRSLRDATSIGATMDYYYGYQPEVHSTVELCFMLWQGECNKRFEQLKANEEELNRIFIDIYGLQDELTPEVADKDVTVRRADLGRDIRSLISYAVGCMFGRYSLDVPGLAYAGGEWDAAKYQAFQPDRDGVLPITDDEYFQDDIVNRFVKFIEVVFGPNELEDNLKYIASALYPNGGGTARDLIRQYFLNDFYKDHLKVYQKRPIYWLFDAGKKNSFKCLIYLHRYRPDTVARVRTDYVHEMQARYRTAMEELTRRVDSASGSERVKLQKQLAKVQAQDQELRIYEEKIHHYADMMLPLDLDDGVKVNYAKLQDVLAPIK